MLFYESSEQIGVTLAHAEPTPNSLQPIQIYAKIPEPVQNPCIKKNVGEGQQAIVRELSIKSGNDKIMLATFDAENGTLDPQRQSDVYTKGVREPSFGICQVHRPSHPDIVNDPRFFTDIHFQIDKCIELYRANEKIFHGGKQIARTLPHFECPAE